MDESDAPHNRSNDDAELSKSSLDENSFIGKMKFGVSKILPNSLSKWLSPKVDITNARRRRHAEMDSDDEGAIRNDTSSATDNRYNAQPQLGVPPPNKKKKTFSDFLSRHTLDLDSPAPSSLIGERSSNIVSSTLIEDVPHRTTNNQLNRFKTVENGQHAGSAAATTNQYNNNDDLQSRHIAINDRYNNDEGSSSQSREKPVNPFAINNESTVVNFSAHLQRAKSLFTNRSYLSPRLKNYRMRNPRSSLYRSTSSLCDNNSVSSNASSAMSSPFYNGQTTFGGASSISRRMNMTPNLELSMHHRPKVPTNLVTSRSTSSLNTIGTTASTSMSTTAKRILDVMSKYNTPLTEVRRISNALPSISESNALNKHKTFLDLDTTTAAAHEMDKTKRTLMKPNTPYNRPFGRNPVESVLTTELHVPSMPELLQLKKFATNTVKIREIANKSENIINRPVHSTMANDFKNSTAKKSSPVTDGRDLDVSNNNKFVNNKNAQKLNSSANDVNKREEHRNKIRSNINKRKVGKCGDDNEMPQPVNLPNISLMMDKKAEIQFSEPLKFPNTDQKTTSSDNGIQIPFKFKSSNTNASIVPSTIGTTASATKEKHTNGNNDILKTFAFSPSKSTTITANNDLKTNFTFKPQSVPQNNSKSVSTYKFADPIIVQASQTKSTNTQMMFNQKMNFKFSEPTFVNDKGDVLSKQDTAKSFGNFKFDANPIKSVSSDSGIETTQSFGSNANKSTGIFGTKPTFVSSTDSAFSAGKSVSSIETQLKDGGDGFKSLVAKQKQGKWECKECCVSNDTSVDKCVCCGAANKDAAAAVAAVKSTSSTSGPPADDIFKSIVAKQKQSKWECKSCMTQNDQAQSKCLCCGESNPTASSSNVTDSSKAAAPKPTFSFGSFPSASTSNVAAIPSKPDSVMKSIVEKQKSSWECSACLSANDMSKSKCACCEQSRDVTKGATSSGALPAKSTFSFGSNATTSIPKSTFSFGSNPGLTAAAPATASFSFGNLDANKSKPAAAQPIFGNLKSNDVKSSNTETDKVKETTATPSTGFSFGSSTVLPSTSSSDLTAKPAADDMFKSIINKQKNSSWECASCMTKNGNELTKCLCCETPKDGTQSNDSAKKDLGLSAGKTFSFGSTPVGSSFSFGSKPESKPSFQFGAPSSSNSTTQSSTVTSTTNTSLATSNVFGSGFKAPTFTTNKTDASVSVSQQATVPTATSAPAPAAAAALSGFKFSFGSTSATTSKDETDTGPKASATSVNVLENVLVKPAQNGPTDTLPKPMFSFGSTATNQTTDEPASKATKRSNTDQADNSILNKFPATSTSSSSTPFIFGQPPATTNTNASNSFSAIATPTVTSTESKPTTQTPTFAFGMSKPSTNTFPSVQPTFSAPTPFSFSANSTAAPTTVSNPFGTTSAAPTPTPSQPVFGSNTFSTPSLGGFSAGNTFGSGTATPAFGAPSSNTEIQTPAAQPSSVFQFGAPSNNTAPTSETPRSGGFNFSLNSAPMFNFSEQAPQQANVPFQFGAAQETPNIFSAQPAASSTVIQQRRKIRPLRKLRP